MFIRNCVAHTSRRNFTVFRRLHVNMCAHVVFINSALRNVFIVVVAFVSFGIMCDVQLGCKLCFQFSLYSQLFFCVIGWVAKWMASIWVWVHKISIQHDKLNGNSIGNIFNQFICLASLPLFLCFWQRLSNFLTIDMHKTHSFDFNGR